MSRLSFCLIVLSVFWFVNSGMVYSGDTPEGVEMSGEYVGPGESQLEAPLAAEAEDGSGYAESFGDEPVISEGLEAMIEGMGPADTVRVIIFLDYQPQNVIAEQVRGRHAAEMELIQAEAKAVLSRYIERRDAQAEVDSVNFQEEILQLDLEDWAILQSIHEGHEALSLTIKDELAAALSQEMKGYQESVQADIEALGGVVEFGTIGVNALVAVVPVGILDSVSQMAKVSQIVEDKAREAHLNIADDATLVNATGGLWADAQDGGLYDPAVLDTGTYLDHPALEDSTTPLRNNFYSHYLEAAKVAGNWNDIDGINDLQGHGTHVMGIVASYDSTYQGMAHGVDKAVTLKAGYRKDTGGGSMYDSDAMRLVDRALYNSSALNHASGTPFSDDLEGINLSFGGDTTSDETSYSRFWDSVISTYSDLVVTISAGNSGPSNPDFCNPACNYNAITVANVDDRNTADRDDDIIRSSSTRGPTANGRRKPDIAAPGTYIYSCNNNWEGLTSDFINKSGTSMSAPMVLGVAMDLMDAGVLDELEIKALLINTAQKNNTNIDFESDADGWSEAFGWGYMNAWSAYYHRGDVRKTSVTESGNAGDYKLYKGQMRDEGSSGGDGGYGEGRDRVTMVWNRHATYNPHAYPTTYYKLSDLNLRLYRESNNGLIDTDFALDNVHQVRIGAGAGLTDVVVKPYAYSLSFAHGGSTEEFALATEEGFVEVSLPASFQGIHYGAGEVEPGEIRDWEFSVRNDSDIASHSNQFDLIVPTGWTFVSGSDPYSAGSIAGGGGDSSHVIWRLQAQGTLQDGVGISFNHTHNSYAESWGPFKWTRTVNVRWDTTPPSPNPPTWATEPHATGTDSISMTTTTCTDLHGPVEYYFYAFTSPTGGTGQTHSGYQTGTSYTDDGLEANHQYRYDHRARDNASSKNYTDWSDPDVYVYTWANVPNPPIVANPTPVTLDVSIDTGDGNPDWTEYALYLHDFSTADHYYLDVSGGDNGMTPVWQTAADWGTVTATGLTPGNHYGLWARARNGDQIQTGWSGQADGYTGSIVVTSPNGGEIMAAPGDPDVILWTSSNVPGNVKIELSRNDGMSWITVVHDTANDGRFEWNVTGPGSTHCLFRVTALDYNVCSDTSDAVCTILPLAPNNPRPRSGQGGVSPQTHLNWNGVTCWYNESFNDGLAQDWDEDVDADWSVVSREYQAYIAAPPGAESMIATYSGQRFANFTFEAKMHRAESSGWARYMLFRASPDIEVEPTSAGSGYAFGVDNTSFLVFKNVSGVQTIITGWIYSDYIKRPPESNTLRVVAVGSQLEFYINGNLVHTLTDPDLTIGRVGLLGYTNSTNICTQLFDEVKVCEPMSRSAVISAKQQWYNDHPLEGGTTANEPENAEVPAYPGATADAAVSTTDQDSGPARDAGVRVTKAPADVQAAIDSIIAKSGVLEGPVVVSSAKLAAGVCSGVSQPVTYTRADEIAGVKTAGEIGITASASLDVAVCGAEQLAWNQDVQSKLLGTGQFNSVSIIDVRTVTPTLAELQAFDAVIVYSDYPYADSAALGDVMADYVDGGGGVVSTMFEVGAGGGTTVMMQGRWDSQGYYAIPRSGQTSSGPETLGTVFDPGHPILQGVTSFNGGSSSYRMTTYDIAAGSTRIADWSDGRPLVVTKEINNVNRCDLGFFPPSSDARSDLWDASTDGALLMANALSWVASSDVAIFQDQIPWGSTRNQDVLTANGYSWKMYGSGDMGSVDLSFYKKVIIASAQPSTFYDALEANAAWFEDYVAAGGILNLHACAYTSTPVPGKILPGGFMLTWQTANDMSIADLTHPVVTLPHHIMDVELDDISWSTHGYFSGVPAGALAIIEIAADNSKPCTMDLPVGAGRILATVQTVEFSGNSAHFHENLLLSGLAIDTTYDVYLDTVNPPTTLVRSGVTVPSCDPTPGAWLNSCDVYYWKVVAKNRLGHTVDGPVWKFKTRMLGDLSNNGAVDLTDYGMLAPWWGTTSCQASGWCDEADMNRDKEVGVFDLSLMLSEWLDTCP